MPTPAAWGILFPFHFLVLAQVTLSKSQLLREFWETRPNVGVCGKNFLGLQSL